MNKVCKVCGYKSENVWRDGKYYCAACGSEIDMTQPDNDVPQQGNNDLAPQTGNTYAADEVVINAVCPICKNASNNTLRNGKGHCALCGTSFDLAQAYNPQPSVNVQDVNRAKRAELEQKKNKKMILGIVFLFIFWPVSIIFFYEMYQISKEISNL